MSTLLLNVSIIHVINIQINKKKKEKITYTMVSVKIAKKYSITSIFLYVYYMGTQYYL